MEIIETFGHYVENLTDKKPQSARRLLKTGWEAQNLKFRYMQDKRLMPADRHLANLMMDTMLRPLQKPEASVIVSIFTPTAKEGITRFPPLSKVSWMISDNSFT